MRSKYIGFRINTLSTLNPSAFKHNNQLGNEIPKTTQRRSAAPERTRTDPLITPLIEIDDSGSAFPTFAEASIETVDTSMTSRPRFRWTVGVWNWDSGRGPAPAPRQAFNFFFTSANSCVMRSAKRFCSDFREVTSCVRTFTCPVAARAALLLPDT
jgi:hypothetical protein